MMRRAIDLGPLLLVALEANFGLRLFVARFIVGGMNLMARTACEVARCVSARLPMNTIAALMAGQACLVACGDRRGRLFRECTFGSRTFFRVRRLVNVRFAGAMAIDAARRSAVGGRAMARLADREHA